MANPKIVLFACVHNAGRSKMAEAIFNELADCSTAQAISAGTEPAQKIPPAVIEVMKEVNIDLSSKIPQKLSDELASQARFLITMGCGEVCPVVPGLNREDWSLEDPKGQPIEKVREIRNKIREFVDMLVKRENWR